MTTIPGPSVDAAVDRELRRRRNLLFVYFAAFLIPIIAGGIALTRSRSERELYTEQTLKPTVTQELSQQLPAALGTTLQPEVNRAVASAVKPAVEELTRPRFAQIDQSIEFLRESPPADDLARRDIAALRTQVAQVDRLNADVQTITRDIRTLNTAELKEQLASIQRTQGRIEENVTALRGRIDDLDSLRKDMTTFETRLKRIEAQRERPTQ